MEIHLNRNTAPAEDQITDKFYTYSCDLQLDDLAHLILYC